MCTSALTQPEQACLRSYLGSDTLAVVTGFGRLRYQHISDQNDELRRGVIEWI